MFIKIKNLIFGHKIVSISVVIVLAIASYFTFFHNKNEVSYTTDKVKRGDITVSVSGTGQIEALNTINLEPKISGDINYVSVSVGDFVKKGKLIASVDYRDAKNDLLLAELNLKDLKTLDNVSLIQKENSLEESYDNAWNEVSLFMNYAITTIDDLEDLYNQDGFLGYRNTINLSSTGKEKIRKGEDSLYVANKNLEKLNKVYSTLSRNSDNETKENFIKDAYQASVYLSNTVKDTETAFNYVVKDFEYSYSDDKVLNTSTNVSSWIKQFNNYSLSLLSQLNTLKESKESYAEFIAGADEITLKQAEISLENAKNNYNDHFIYAPFDGVVATLLAKVGESSGSSIGSLITKENIAVVPFNEVDIASVSLGQNVNLTFDAISGLSLTGTVVEIDALGTVESGVVSYNVKIGINEKDERVKPGMSVNANITIESKKNILVVPSSVVKTRNGKSYVEVVKNRITERVEVEIGISDDSITEILSGLNEGDDILVKTNTSSDSSNSNPSSRNGMMGGPSMGGAAMGGFMR